MQIFWLNRELKCEKIKIKFNQKISGYDFFKIEIYDGVILWFDLLNKRIVANSEERC